MLDLPNAPPPLSAKTVPVVGLCHAESAWASGFADHLQDAFDRSQPEPARPNRHEGKGASCPTSIASAISEPRASLQTDEREDESSLGTDLAPGSEGGLVSGVNPNKAETSSMPDPEAGRLPGDTALNTQAEAAIVSSSVTAAQMNTLQAGLPLSQVAAGDQAQLATGAIMGPDQALKAAGADEALGVAASLVQAAAKDGNAPAAASGKTPLAAFKADAETPKPADPAALLLRAIAAATAARDVGQEPAKMTEWVAPAAGLLASQLPGAEERAEVPQGPAPLLLPMDAAHRQAEAVLHSQASRDAAPAPMRQLAPVVVSLALGRGDDSLTVALDPGELGRVEVSIGQGKEAGQIRIVAERPETLALLQRDQRELDRALSQAGLGDLGRSIAFSLASDQGRQRDQGGGQDKGKRGVGLGLGADGDRLIAPEPVQPRLSTSLIDLAV